MTNLKNLVRVSVGLLLVGVPLYFIVMAPHRVRAVRASHGPVIEEALGSGSIESRRSASVGFEVTGRIASMLADQGDSVSSGQELARLDEQVFAAEADSAKHAVALAESTLERLKADIKRADAVLEGARDNLERVVPLVKSGTLPMEQLDIGREREKVALAEGLRAAAALTEGKAAIGVAQAKLLRSQVDLARCILRSPFDAVVTLREREAGDVAVPGSPVLRLAASDTIWSSVWVDETHLGALRVGMPARIVMRSNTQRELQGKLVRIGREVDRETRELLVDVSFDQLPRQLVFGQRVDVWIELARNDQALRIPVRCVVSRAESQGVFVERDGRARFQALEFGAIGGQFIEVRAGLQEGAAVLEPRSASLVLREGLRVRVDLEQEVELPE